MDVDINFWATRCLCGPLGDWYEHSLIEDDPPNQHGHFARGGTYPWQYPSSGNGRNRADSPRPPSNIESVHGNLYKATWSDVQCASVTLHVSTSQQINAKYVLGGWLVPQSHLLKARCLCALRLPSFYPRMCFDISATSRNSRKHARDQPFGVLLSQKPDEFVMVCCYAHHLQVMGQVRQSFRNTLDHRILFNGFAIRWDLAQLVLCHIVPSDIYVYEFISIIIQALIIERTKCLHEFAQHHHSAALTACVSRLGFGMAGPDIGMLQFLVSLIRNKPGNPFQGPRLHPSSSWLVTCSWAGCIQKPHVMVFVCCISLTIICLKPCWWMTAIANYIGLPHTYSVKYLSWDLEQKGLLRKIWQVGSGSFLALLRDGICVMHAKKFKRYVYVTLSWM